MASWIPFYLIVSSVLHEEACCLLYGILKLPLHLRRTSFGLLGSSGR